MSKSKIVKKWVAGWDVISDEVIVIEYDYRETPKKFIMVPADTAEWRRVQRATRYKEYFHKDGPQRLFDSAAEALAWLETQEQRKIDVAHSNIEDAFNRIAEIVKTRANLA